MSDVPQSTSVIQFDDFARVEMKVGTVIKAEAHPNADKLLVLQVDLGGEQRQILSGIKTWYTPESLVGKQVVVVTNLAPRALRGLESQGMVLAASTADRSDVVLLTPLKPVPPGSKVS